MYTYTEAQLTNRLWKADRRRRRGARQRALHLAVCEVLDHGCTLPQVAGQLLPVETR